MMSLTRFSRHLQRILIFAVLAILAVPASVSAIQFVVGQYKIDVDVRSDLFFLIPHANVTCKQTGQVIKISASAPGFVAKTKEIRLVTGNNSYSTTIILPDQEKRMDIFDFNHKPIISAYIDRFQGGTPTNLYAINLMLPIKTWPQPSAANVTVNQPGYGWPVHQSCNISLFEDFYRVRLIIARIVLDDPKEHLLIYVNTADNAALKQRFNELHLE